MVKRTIPNYQLDLISIVDISKTLERCGVLTIKRVLDFIVKKYLGPEFYITKAREN